jgi:hypothetical protein
VKLNASMSRWLLIACGLLALMRGTLADELPEYRLKAAFLYNFALFTEWPADVGRALNLCVYGHDPFGKEIDGLQGKEINERSLVVKHRDKGESLTECQIVFISASETRDLEQILGELRGKPVLTIADSVGAARAGTVLNMAVAQSKITFEANLQVARAAGLRLSSKLLRLATEVYQ